MTIRSEAAEDPVTLHTELESIVVRAIALGFSPQRVATALRIDADDLAQIKLRHGLASDSDR